MRFLIEVLDQHDRVLEQHTCSFGTLGDCVRHLCAEGLAGNMDPLHLRIREMGEDEE